MAHIYQTPAAPLFGIVQPIIAIESREGPTMSFDGIKRLDKFAKLFPIRFGGTPFEDPHDFLDRYHVVLGNMGIVESNGSDFVVFQMHGSTKRWYQKYVRGKPTGSPPLTWDQFSHIFLDKFIPFTLRKDYRNQFEHIQ